MYYVLCIIINHFSSIRKKNITGLSVSDKPSDFNTFDSWVTVSDKPSEFDTFDAYVERFGCSSSAACKINKFGANDQVVNDKPST
jgi:hypothetical protein